jgi:hypothetical protein
MGYTYPLPTNATQPITGLFSMMQYVNNDLSGGIFALLIMLAVFIIVFVSLKDRTRSSGAFLAASFFNVIIAIFFRTMSLISNTWMYLSIVIVAFGFFWTHIDNKKIGL